jgi:hypothetical protein
MFANRIPHTFELASQGTIKSVVRHVFPPKEKVALIT